MAKRLDTDFANQEWKSLFSGTVDPAALAPSGNYFYRLDVFLANDCDSPVDTSQAVLNAFKVRTTGEISIRSGTFGFVGADVYGGFTAPDPRAENTLDTSYDGRFEFFVDVGLMGQASQAEILLRDADADVVTDDDPAVSGPFGPDDVQSPGVADGKSDATHYVLLRPDGTEALRVTNPSGNFDEISGVMDKEEHKVATGLQVPKCQRRVRQLPLES